MVMPERYIIAFILLILTMLGWNVFLIQRDAKLFDSYANQKEKVCAQLNTWHPDCPAK
jgi:hypothetical protein